MKPQPRFLETITFMGNDMLIPINSIRCVYSTFEEDGCAIIIKFEDNNKTSEHFEDEDKMTTRFNKIKYIIGAE